MHLPVYFAATDKVALLIGNYDYLSQLPLKAPQTDIQNLSHIFEACLGFKVCICLCALLSLILIYVVQMCFVTATGV